ncbi:polysaccharide export outer membrane protein [Sphingomonas vulcanisoli]|uniref:Polysaccharide export outer membrane protein n=1 Tax=Sphingomonas vulcanisoli TaxID=1658060 RepID=A0ABX0TRA9_9SPHN|nr:polysaccharide biosynthesis/export family protein [Sphingomonas vulcanisoli]NIJ08063.1 polysaccharide export outer membrane protein [Sphingomonas vulcanisoli]
MSEPRIQRLSRRLLLAMLASIWAAMAGPAIAQSSEYRIGPGDVLKVSVYRQADLETIVAVAGDGTIPIGTLGKVPVADLTPGEVGQRIAERLKSAGILIDPTVTVLVTEYHSQTVAVLGAVARPGEYPIDRRGITISEMLARAGANFASGGILIAVKPRAGGESENLHAADLFAGGRDRPVRNGDTIFVQTPALVFVRGEVQHPGAFPIEPGMTVDQAIAVAGGLTQRGSASGVRVTHVDVAGKAGTPQRIKLRDTVAPNDTLVVGARLF